MLQSPGMSFSDPRIDTESSSVPGGYKLTTLIVSLQEGNGVVGWQNIWRAGMRLDRMSHYLTYIKMALLIFKDSKEGNGVEPVYLRKK